MIGKPIFDTTHATPHERQSLMKHTKTRRLSLFSDTIRILSNHHLGAARGAAVQGDATLFTCYTQICGSTEATDLPYQCASANPYCGPVKTVEMTC